MSKIKSLMGDYLDICIKVLTLPYFESYLLRACKGDRQYKKVGEIQGKRKRQREKDKAALL